MSDFGRQYFKHISIKQKCILIEIPLEMNASDPIGKNPSMPWHWMVTG